MSDPSFFKHSHALVDTDAIWAETRIWAFAHVMKDVCIGEQCNICDHAFIENGVSLGNRVTIKNNVFVCRGVEIADDVFVGPCVVFTNDFLPRSGRMPEVSYRYRDESAWLRRTVLDRGVSIGANATIVCGVTIGKYATIGAGAVVIRDVAPYALVVGNPGRRIGHVCRCGEKLEFREGQAGCACGREYRLVAGEGESAECLPLGEEKT